MSGKSEKYSKHDDDELLNTSLGPSDLLNY